MSIYIRREDLEDLIFRVDKWFDGGNRIECCVAACMNLPLGLAAFDAAVKQYPNNYLTLRNKSWVVKRHEGSPPDPNRRE
jgi:hypothetical protein